MERLIIVDAVEIGQPAGSCVRLAGDEVPMALETKLSPHQMRHWKKFAEHHPLRECQTCNAMVLECDLDAPPGQEHQSPPPEKTAASECGGRKQKAWV
ncbi:hypothetical protein SDC9_114216 [bioreactor metagenome]|uniref:Uncharacterized protein n=1 Tax=bioreactor metagenome TaxID=1076179 RepID=A0A645BZZ8_9ZZZZ